MNVVLHEARADHAGWLATWLPAVAQSLRYPYSRIDEALHSSARSLIARIIERDGDAVGVVVGGAAAPSATIELVATLPGAARRGSGMTAAAMLEDELRAMGARSIVVPAPAVHGIAVYFWIRLGYRPLARKHWPCEQEEVAWFVRDLPAKAMPGA